MSKSLAYVLKVARKSAGLTQNALAEIVGVSRAAIGQWEAGVHEPSTDNLIAVCRALGVDLESATRGEVRSTDTHHLENQDVTNSLSADLSFKILGGLGSAVFRRKTENEKHLIPMFIGHTIGDEAYSYVSASSFSDIPRPVVLRGNQDAYAFIISDETLYPKFEINDIVYIDPRISPKPNDYVIVRSGVYSELKRPSGGDGIMTEKCVLGRVIGVDVFGLRIAQHNPARETTVNLGQGVSVHRIFPMGELIPTG